MRPLSSACWDGGRRPELTTSTQVGADLFVRTGSRPVIDAAEWNFFTPAALRHALLILSSILQASQTNRHYEKETLPGGCPGAALCHLHFQLRKKGHVRNRVRN